MDEFFCFKKASIRFFISIVAFLCLGAIKIPCLAHGGDESTFAPDPKVLEKIEVDEQGKKALGIELGTVRRQLLNDNLQATGEVQAAETQAFDVNPPVSGLVKAVYAKQGDAVHKGQTLALVYSIEVADNLTRLLNERTKINSEIARVQTGFKSDIVLQTSQLHLLKSNFEREDELMKEGIAARKSYQEAKNAYESGQVKLSTLRQRLEQDVKLLQRQLEVTTDTAKGQLKIMGISEATVDMAITSGRVTADLPITAPVAGCITTRSITLGERVDPSKKVFSIVNLNPIWVMVDIFQEQIPSVREGQQVIIRTPSKEILKGVISSVGSIVDSSTKTLHVRIVADNPQGVLRPNMFVTAQIAVNSKTKEALAVPESAIIDFEGHAYVFERDGNSFQPIQVETGLHSNGRVEILRGLSEGDSIVVSGARQLGAQSLLKPGVSHAHEGEAHENHREHEAQEEHRVGLPITMFMFFLGGLVTALILVGVWFVAIKIGKSKGNK